MDLIIFLFLSGVLVICDGLHVLGPSGPLTLEPGGSVMMPCYVEAPISLEVLEVEWTRTDSETVVHLFQVGKSRPESQHPAYSGRASFFTEEVQRGNFSLLLTNLTTKDAGDYKCSVFKQQETGQTLMTLVYLIVTGGNAEFLYTRGNITLNCAVASSIPPEELDEVTWKKVDQETIVLVFQQGFIETGFTHERFKDRVEFFGPKEILNGDFSLKLKDVRMEDEGLYRCDVHSGKLSAHATVEILHLGFSPIHYVMLFLWSCTCLCGLSLVLGCIPYTFCKGPGSATVVIQHVLVFCPNILMFVAFILWGVLEGLVIEAVTFSTINFLRTLRLLPFSPYTYNFEGKFQVFVVFLPILEWVALSVITAVVFELHGWQTQNKVWMGFAGCGLVLNIIFILAPILLILADTECIGDCLINCFFGALIIRGLMDVGFLIFLFVTDEVVEVTGNKGLICLIVLTFCCIILLFTVILTYVKYGDQISEQNEDQTSPVLIKIPYTLEVAVLFLVNSVTLAVSLIRQAGDGERIVEDLRLILLPLEMVFMIVCSFAFWYYSSPRRANRNSML